MEPKFICELFSFHDYNNINKHLMSKFGTERPKLVKVVTASPRREDLLNENEFNLIK